MGNPIETAGERGNLVDLAERYITHRLRVGEIVPLTARNDRCALRVFVAACDDAAPPDVGREHGRAWAESLEGMAPNTRRRRFATVKGFCRWALAEGHFTSDPLAGLRPPRHPRAVPRALPADDVARLIAACPDARARLIVLLMVQLGLRCVEVARLKLSDFDEGQGIVRVRGKGDHERILPVLDEVRPALAEYLAAEPRQRPGLLIRSRIFPEQGLGADTISGMVGRWMVAAGIKQKRRDGVSAHALRHTAATDMLLAGAHLRDIQQALGHAHLITTEVYLAHEVRGNRDAMSGRSYAQASTPGPEVAAALPAETEMTVSALVDVVAQLSAAVEELRRQGQVGALNAPVSAVPPEPVAGPGADDPGRSVDDDADEAIRRLLWEGPEACEQCGVSRDTLPAGHRHCPECGVTVGAVSLGHHRSRMHGVTTTPAPAWCRWPVEHEHSVGDHCICPLCKQIFVMMASHYRQPHYRCPDCNVLRINLKAHRRRAHRWATT